MVNIPLRHVWLVKTPSNETAARLVWKREAHPHSHDSGVTIFDPANDASETFYNLLTLIDEHHGGVSTQAPWEQIHAIGFPLCDAVPDRIAEALALETVTLKAQADGYFTIGRHAKTATHGKRNDISDTRALASVARR